MVRTRAFRLGLVAVAALGLSAGACKKKEEKKGTTGDQTTGAPGQNPLTKPAGAGAMIAGAEDLALLPSDSELVIGLNFDQLKKSALWQQFAPKIMEKAASELAEFKTMCGFDPMEKFKSVSLGLKGLEGKAPDGAVVIHGLDKTQTMACLEKGKAELAKKGTEITVDGEVVLTKSKSGETSAWTFIDGDTMLGTTGTAGTKDGVLAAAKGTAGLKSSQKFVEMYSKINTGESLWFLVNGNAPFMAKASLPGSKPQAIFGSLNVTDGLTVDVRMRMATADEAKAMVDMMKGQTNNAQVKQMFDKLDVGVDANDAKLSLAMSQEKLKNLAAMIGGMMGGMMGGGGGMGGP
jgi:hypothetical protein